MTTKEKVKQRARIKFKPHKGQKKILDERERFNCLNLGRRFGKTYLGTYLLLEAALPASGGSAPVAWYSPSYKDLHQVWKKVKKKLAPIIKNKSEQLKYIELVNGSVIDFWSLDDIDNSRGRRYKRIIVDEVAKIRNFTEAYRQTLRPTLSDFEGDAYFLSTPKGKSNHWYDFSRDAQKKKDWAYFCMPTSTNPHIPKSEIQAAKEELPKLDFLQEYEAQFVDFNREPFVGEFNSDKHVVEGDIPVNMNIPLTLSWDFNYSPTTCILIQKDDDGLKIIEEYQAIGGTENVLEKLDWIRDFKLQGKLVLQICGDVSGRHRHSSSRYTDWDLIEDFFGQDASELTYKANKEHIHSRKIVNTVFKNIPVKISESNCPNLITDIRTAEPTPDGRLKKDDSKNRNDAFDAMRYGFHFYFQDTRDIIQYRDSILDISQRNEQLKQTSIKEKEEFIKKNLFKVVMPKS